MSYGGCQVQKSAGWTDRLETQERTMLWFKSVDHLLA